MAHHVIIGGGPAATNAIEAIRQCEAEPSRITLVCDEPAYSRMALPYWLSGQTPREHVLTADRATFQRLGVEPRIGVRAERIDPAARAVVLSDGGQIAYDDLLLATGAAPVGLPVPGANLPGVLPLWNLAHTQAVLDQTAGLQRPRVVLIGAGFIGLIVLNAMYKRGWQLAVVEREAQLLPRMLDADSARIAQSWLQSKQVSVHLGAVVQEIREQDGALAVVLGNGSTLPADLAIVATGIRPNLELANGAGIETDQGILVDDRMQTNVGGIYAGGDVAQGPVLYGNGPAIHAIQPTAVDHGRVAGANMAGREVHYPGSLSMNILDVCGLQCASFGAWAGVDDCTVVSNPAGRIYRKFVWGGDALTGAIFVGRANDMGMLTDVGMVKGILQTQTVLGAWKHYLVENPFDVRRVYIATGVADRLTKSTLLGLPARNRQYRFGGALITNQPSPAHAVYVSNT